MASLFRKARSPFWWVAYFDSAGKRHFQSTKRRNKAEAILVGAEKETLARKAGPDDSSERQQIFRIVEDAANLALKGTLTASGAQKMISKVLEAATGETIRPTTVKEWFAGWLSDKSKSRSQGTHVRYTGVIEAFLQSLPAGKRSGPLGAISIEDVRRYRDGLLTGGRTAVTANIALKVVRAPFALARRQGLIEVNPAEGLELLSANGSEKAVFTDQDISKLCGVADFEWRGLILTGYYTGGRLSDLVNLTWNEVSLEKRSLGFCQRKTKRFIEIPLHGEVERWFREAATARKGEKVFNSLEGRTSGGKSGLSEKFKHLMVQAGIASTVTPKAGGKGRNRHSLSFHALRHSFNSAMANAGVAQEVRQRLTGHSSKAVNDRYTHTQLDTLRKAVETIPPLQAS